MIGAPCVAEAKFEAGVEVGQKSFFHLNGSKAEQGPLVDGVPHGARTFWDESGKQLNVVKYVNRREVVKVD